MVFHQQGQTVARICFLKIPGFPGLDFVGGYLNKDVSGWISVIDYNCCSAVNLTAGLGNRYPEHCFQSCRVRSKTS